MSYNGTFENLIRVGIIEAVDYARQQCTIRLYDRIDQQRFSVALPNPSSGMDSGVYHHPEPGTMVAVGWSYREQPVILTTLPSSAFSKDSTLEGNSEDIYVGTSGYPKLGRGEVALSGIGGTEIRLANLGCINMSFGDSFFDLDCSDRSVLSVKETLQSTEAGFKVSGVILRDLRSLTSKDEALENKITNSSYLRNLTPISRDPIFAPASITSSLKDGLSEAQRNPPFIENKSIVYEFAKSYMVDTLDEEASRLNEDEEHDFLFQPSNRNNTRYNILNLNTDNPNLLIEKTEGTLVDIYGNILDLNRSPILFPGDTEGKKSTKERLRKLETLTRRSVKLHYEINSRKASKGQVSTTTLEGGDDLAVGHTHSRWSFDVDGEGLTKINIPASSNVGNIPLLTRYVTANLRAKDSTDESASQTSDSTGNDSQFNDISNPRDIFFRPTSVDGVDTNQDIFHLAYGDLSSDGIPVHLAPGNIGEKGGPTLAYRTAYHDIVNTAPKALVGPNIPGTPGQSAFVPDGSADAFSNLFDDIVGAAASSLPVSSAGASTPATPPTAIRNISLNNAFAEEGAPVPNVGGRSIFANLDGSVEFNIGRDFIDHKSMVLDTSGGIISRIGKTRAESNNASIISQLDGSVFIQIGGDSIEGEEKIADPKVKLVVQGSKGTDEISIDANAVRIKTAASGKNLILESSKNLILKANGVLMLAGSTVAVHGTVDDTGDIISPARLISQTGKEI